MSGIAKEEPAGSGLVGRVDQLDKRVEQEHRRRLEASRKEAPAADESSDDALRRLAMAQLAEAEQSGAVALVRALGHPVRLRLVQAVIQGQCTIRELSALDGMGTSGQLYHHLRLLTDAGWLRRRHRGEYTITEERAKGALLAVAAAKSLTSSC